MSSSVFLNLPEAKLENILLDYINNRLLVADEASKKIKIYDFNGNLIKVIYDIFQGDPEGIIMTNNSYIFTDQNIDKSLFHVFDTTELNYMSSFHNNYLKNTEGITYDSGHIYAINDNCSISKIKLQDDQYNFKNLILAGVVVYLINNFI